MNQRMDADTGQRSGQPAPVLVSWLSDLVDEARRTIFPRLSDACRQLQSGELQWECAAFGGAVAHWADAASRLDPRSAHPGGHWARLTGRSQRSVREFSEGVVAVSCAAAQVRCEFDAFQCACRSQQAVRKLLVELQFEAKALAEELEPATDWLAEVADAMRKATAAHAANRTWAAAAARVETLPRDIKQLHEAVITAQAVGAMGLKILGHRGEALGTVRALLDGFDRNWMLRVPALAGKPAAVVAASAITPGVVHEELVQGLDALSQFLHEIEIEAGELQRLLSDLAEIVA